MTTPTLFAAAQLGTSLALERGDTVLTYTTSADINRCCRCTEPKDSGRWRAEFYLWGDAAIANAVSIGVVKSTHPLTNYVGGHADGYGYRVAEGQIHNNGSSIAGVTAGAKKQIIEVSVDLTDAGDPIAQWRLDGVVIHTQDLPDTGPWMLAVTVSGSTGYDLFVMISSGQRGKAEYESPLPWWTAVRTAMPMLRIAERGFISSADSSTPLARYRGLLREDSRLSLRRSVRAWPMRQPNAGGFSGGGGSLRLASSDRSLDALVNAGGSGARVRLLRVPDPVDGVVDMAEAVAVDELILDRAEAIDDNTVELVLSDPISVLEAALSRRLAPPYAAEASADQPLPVSIGAVRSITPMLISSADRKFALHDDDVTGLGTVRDGGFPYNPLADPTPYELNTRGELIIIELALPTYLLTADLHVATVDYAPPAVVDILDGDGDPFAGTIDAVPTNFTTAAPAGDVKLISGGRTRWRQDTGIETFLLHDTAECEAGKKYKITVTLDQIAGLNPASTRGKFALCSDSTAPSAFFTLQGTAVDSPNTPGYQDPGDEAEGLSLPHTFTAFYYPSTTHDVYLAYLGNTTIDNGLQTDCIVSLVTVEEIPPVSYTDDEEAEPLPLTPTLQRLLEGNAGFVNVADNPNAARRWDSTVAETLDGTAGSPVADVPELAYAGTGIHVAGGEEATIETAARVALDAYACDFYRKPDGTIGIWTLTLPEDRTPTGTITRATFFDEPKIRRHRAPGLSRQARCRRNWTPLAGNMSTDTTELTPDVRAKLAADYRIGLISGVAVTPFYERAAAGVPPKGLALDKRADGQHAMDRVRAYYATDRFEVEGVVPWRDAYEIGTVWLVDYTDIRDVPPYITGPRNMEIIDLFDFDPIAGTVGLLLVG